MNLGAVYKFKNEPVTTVQIDLSGQFFELGQDEIVDVELSAAIWNSTEIDVTQERLSSLEAYKVGGSENWRIVVRFRGGYIGASPYRVSVQGTTVHKDGTRQGFIHYFDMYVVSSHDDIVRLGRQSARNVSYPVMEEGRPLSEVLSEYDDEPTTEEKAEQAQFELDQVLQKARRKLGAAKHEIRVIRINRNRRTRT